MLSDDLVPCLPGLARSNMLKEYFSLRDVSEVVMCIREINSQQR